MKRLTLCSIVLLASFAFVFGLSGNAQALLTCTLGSTEACTEISGSGVNDFAGNVIPGTLFGDDDWEYIAKQNIGGDLEGDDIDLVVTGTTTGMWQFNSSLWDSYDEIFVLLKDGQDTEGNFWYAYLLPEGCYGGTWTYPLGKELSYLAVYGRGGTSVPDASVMLLLGSSFLGFAVFSRKRKKS